MLSCIFGVGLATAYLSTIFFASTRIVPSQLSILGMLVHTGFKERSEDSPILILAILNGKAQRIDRHVHLEFASRSKWGLTSGERREV